MSKHTYCEGCNDFFLTADTIRKLLHKETRLDPAEWEDRCPTCGRNQEYLHQAYECSACSDVQCEDDFVFETDRCTYCEAVYAAREHRDPYPEGRAHG
jgi:hypothetical protein